MDMLILRRSGKGLEAVGTSGIKTLVQDLSPSDVRGLSRDESVLASAQSMPLKLIGPHAATVGATVAPTVESPTAWGVKAVGADTSPFTGKGVTVAVLDTGIDVGHAAFSGVTFEGRNFGEGAPDDIRDLDEHGHGTHCAGTIFGRPVQGIRIGVAPGVTKALIGRVLGPGGGSTGSLYSAINWAIEKKAQIISMSLGMDLVGFRERLVASGFHPLQATSMAMRVLIDNVRFFDKFGNLLRSAVAFQRSALVVAATGNESDRYGQRPFALDAAYPAASEDFLSVGAVEQTDDAEHPLRVAEFSNARAKICGPGVDVVSAAPGPGEKLRSLGGTSMATPHVAGVAALWAQKLMLHGAPTPGQILEKLTRSARLPAGLDEDDVGYGLAQSPQS